MKNSLEAGRKVKYFWGRLSIREEIASLETMADDRWQKALNNQEQLFGAGTEDKGDILGFLMFAEMWEILYFRKNTMKARLRIYF